MKRNIHIHIFTYSGDSYIIKETVMCAIQALPEAHVVVIDEEDKSSSPEIRQEIEDLGVEWRVSSWPRRGNLRGKECVLGILSEMYSSAEGDNDLLIKLDADSCLMNGDEFRDFYDDTSKIMCAAGAVDERIHGFCYCIRAHAVKRALECLTVLEIPEHAPEDILIGMTIYHLFPGPECLVIHSPVDVDSTWKAFNWWDYPDPRKYKNLTVVTTGNPPPIPITKKQRPIMMRYLRKVACLNIQRK